MGARMSEDLRRSQCSWRRRLSLKGWSLLELGVGGILFVGNLLLTLELVDCDSIPLESSGSAAINIFGAVGETSEVLGESFLAYFRRNL